MAGVWVAHVGGAWVVRRGAHDRKSSAPFGGIAEVFSAWVAVIAYGDGMHTSAGGFLAGVHRARVRVLAKGLVEAGAGVGVLEVAGAGILVVTSVPACPVEALGPNPRLVDARNSVG